MRTDDEASPPPRRGLRAAVAIIVVLALAASAFAVAQRNGPTNERTDDASGDDPSSDGKEGDGTAEETERDGTAEETEGIDDVFGGDIGTLLECVETAAPPPDPGSDRPETARAQLEEISEAVERLRGLRFEGEVDAKFLHPEAVAKKAARITLRDYPKEVAAAEERLLEALGAIPRRTDLRRLMKRLIESQVAGFYVPSTDQLVVPGNPNDPLTPAQRIILAHELTHAVSDGQLNIPLPEQPQPEDLDKDLAALAIVEGDATLLMQKYATTDLSIFDQLSVTGDPAYQASQEAIEEIPPYLVEQLTFPYVDGLSFACDLYAKGGWKAINRAYAKPPITTAQVLFPQRYDDREKPLTPSSPAAPKGPWRDAWKSTFGAANLLWLFKAPGGNETRALSNTEARVESWAGGTVRVWSRDEDTALALRLIQKGTADLCDAVSEWYGASFDDDSAAEIRTSEEAAFDGGVQSAVISCPRNEIRLGVGPDLATARRAAR
jgi:hypothetical protein